MLNEITIKSLEEKGFKRWQKGNMDRLYINAGNLGLECTYYNTGNISGAWFNGESISNCQARKMRAAKTYINVETGMVISDNNHLKGKAEEILAEVAATI